jgi:hypothetical protein
LFVNESERDDKESELIGFKREGEYTILLIGI